MPWYSDGSLIDWPRGFNLGTDWTHVDTQRTEAFAALLKTDVAKWKGIVQASGATIE